MSLLWFIVGFILILGAIFRSDSLLAIIGLLCFILSELVEIRKELEAEKK